ncbi:immune inhibitor A [Bacillus sp. OV322]|uniref:immune inhibitor A domain-containing protein n=1 Tax=Bacillus sp. OV322 TaxID=1882764 RepID=UPI0008EADD40|nr:immune inhibitor A domain-containing protein [Bacillus sp. OV322]SFC23050.1 immune inhibitor A [Bacillus sp. OV322]
MKRVFKSSITAAIFAGTFFSGFPVHSPGPVNANQLKDSAQSQVSQSQSSLDLSIVNDDKLIDALIKRGVISKNASEANKQKALKNYIAFKGKADKVQIADPLAPKAKAAEAEKRNKFKNYNKGHKGKTNLKGKNHPDPVKETPYTGAKQSVKVLTLMVEYSNFEHNKIQPGETDNYYKDYDTKHYEDMIFGANGVKGPNGENLVSQKQYYEQQSGGTFTVEGKAYGWLKVPGTAKYYGADNGNGGHDNLSPGGARKLVADTYNAAKAAGIPLQDYDLEDPHDLDGDGNLKEPDGLVDHLQIIHSGMGQEAGGGTLGDDAIWSHRSAVLYDPDGREKGLPGFYDYTMMPEDGATGVFAHEFGHDLGLPDEYDTQYTGTGEAIGYWSIMASGSWAGKIPGAEPTGFSPWAKSYFQSTMGGNWTNPTVVDLADVTKKGTSFLLDQANSPNGQNQQAVQVNLPQKKTPINTPAAGTYEYWGGQKDEMDNSMVTNVDLTGKKSATLTFDAWYDMEEQWDYAFVQVSEDGGKTWKSVGNNHTRSDVVAEGYPTIINSMPGFTGNSNGWQAESFDLSAYAGKNIQLRLRSATDWGSSLTGFFADNIKVTADGQELINDGGENGTSPFTLNGFTKMDGNKLTNHYYLLEWRNHQGVDQGLADIARGNSLMSYDGGLVVWYVDDSFNDNWTGTHPGDGFLGVVDAHDDTNLHWSTGQEASTRYHLADAAFNFLPTSGLNLNYPEQTLTLPSERGIALFNDSKDYNNPYMPDAGRNIGHYGLKVIVDEQATDKSVGAITITK